MNSLIDRVLSVEEEACAIIEKARAEARELEKRAAVDISLIQKEALANVEKKIEAYREQALQKHEHDIAAQEAESRQVLESINQIPNSLIDAQIEKVVARFREI